MLFQQTQGKVQEIYSLKKKSFKTVYQPSQRVQYIFSYILYLIFLITAHVIMSRNQTILPICYIRICNENALYSEFRFTKFYVIVEEKGR